MAVSPDALAGLDSAQRSSFRSIVSKGLGVWLNPYGLIVATVFAVAAATIVHAGRETTFFYDEWDYVIGSRTGGLDVLLHPHNGHLTVIPILVYRALFATVGLRQYAPYRVTLLALHLTCCLFFYVLVRARLARLGALLLTSMLLFLGSGWQDILWPFQIEFLLSIAAGLATLMLLDRRDQIGNVAASGTLVVSVASSGLGIPFVAGAGVAILANRGRWARIWILIPVIVSYGLWYFLYGVPQIKLENIRHISVYVTRSAGGAIGGLTGLGTVPGMLLLVVAVVFVGWRLFRGSLSPAMATFLTVPAVFWTLTALTRADLGEADATRYIYPGALFCLLVAAESLDKAAIPRLLVVAASVLIGVTIGLNIISLVDGGDQLRRGSVLVRAELGAIEIARGSVDQGLTPDSLLMPQVTAGPYLLAVKELGSPADSPDAIRLASAGTRSAVDEVIQRAERPELTSSTAELAPGPLPSVDDASSNSTTDGGCLIINGTRSSTSITSPAGGVSIRSRANSLVNVRVRRFGDAYGAPALPVQGSGPIYLLKLVRDGSTVAWHINVLGSGPLRVCGLPQN